MKTCTKCGTEKPLTEYHKKKRMADGHMNQCKVCVRKVWLKYRWDNIERRRKYDVERGAQPQRREKKKAYYARWRKEHPEKYKAHWTLNNAIRSGKMQRQPCTECGREDTHAHHHDYSKPLDVEWLCPPCHAKRHN